MAGEVKEWYYLLNGASLGPVTEAELKGMLERAELGMQTPVSTLALPDWVPATSVFPFVKVNAAGSVAVGPSPGQVTTGGADLGTQGGQLPAGALPWSGGVEPAADFLGGRPIYFPVSVAKFVTMNIVTLGFYTLFWFYKNWSFLRRLRGIKVSPFLRAWFAVFFCYSLLARIKAEAEEKGVTPTFNAGALTAIYIVLAFFIVNLPAPANTGFMLAFAPLIPAVSTVNRLNRDRIDPSRMNSSFSAWNIAWIVLVSIFSGLALIGFLVPE